MGMKRRKVNKAGLKTAKIEHDKFLRKMGIDPDKKGKLNGTTEEQRYQKKKVEIPSVGCLVGNGTAVDRNTYSGTEIIGIATMHKSNSVPIRRGTNEAIEIAQMSN